MGHGTGAALYLGPCCRCGLREGVPPPLLGHRSLHASDVYRGGPFFIVPWATPLGRVGCP